MVPLSLLWRFFFILVLHPSSVVSPLLLHHLQGGSFPKVAFEVFKCRLKSIDVIPGWGLQTSDVLYLSQQEQWSLDQLRQDLRLTIPDIFGSDHLSPTLWNGHPDFGHGPEKLTRSMRSRWRHNPLEEEEHWIPLHEHHPQAMLQDQKSASGRLVDNCLLSAGLVAHEDDPPCFSPAIISETLLPNSTPKSKDARTLVPVTETEKPSSEDNLLQPEEHMKELPILALPSTQPESWSFTSEDDHPRPESGSVLNSFRGNEQLCSQLAEVPSIDEVCKFLPTKF